MSLSFLTPRVRDAVAVALLAGFLCFHNIGRREIRRASEGRVARVAQEMLDTGDWIVPHLNGVPRLQKPPMSSWLVAFHAKFLGDGSVTVKDALVPPALSATLLIALLYLWLSRLKREGDTEGDSARGAGMFGALALAMMPAFLAQARCAEMDMLVALCTTVAFFAWARASIEGSRGWLVVFYLALTVGFLTKGHVILVLVVPPLIVWGIWEKLKGGRTFLPATATAADKNVRPPEPRRFQFSLQTLMLHVLGFGLFFGIVLAWGIPFLQQSGMTWEAFKTEGLARFSEKTTGHVERFHYYFAHVPHWSMPWFLMLPFAIWRQARAPEDALSPYRRMWWCWLVVNVLLWSMLAAKQTHYATPWLPAIALLAGDTLAGLFFEVWPAVLAGAQSVGKALALVLGGLLALVGVVAPFFLPNPDGLTSEMYVLGGLGALAFGLGTVALALRRGLNPFLCWWAGLACLLALNAATAERREDLKESPAVFCREVRKCMPEGVRLYDACGIADPDVLFYLGCEIPAARIGIYDDKSNPHYWENVWRSIIYHFHYYDRNAYLLINSETWQNIRNFKDIWGESTIEEVFRGDQFNAPIRRGAHLIRPKPQN